MCGISTHTYKSEYVFYTFFDLLDAMSHLYCEPPSNNNGIIVIINIKEVRKKSIYKLEST